jgi:RNA polymerase sigma-70 factor, ECF subfamily
MGVQDADGRASAPLSRFSGAELSILMRAALDGNDGAYNKLLKQLPPLLRIVFRGKFGKYGISAGDQEDIIQDVLIAIHLRRMQWDSTMPLLPWVFAITHNKIIDEVRRRVRFRELDRRFLPIKDIHEETVAINAVHDVGRVLETLPPRNRKIVSSIRIEGYSARELAQQLGISEVAVRIVLHRSLKGLIKAFGSDKAVL